MKRTLAVALAGAVVVGGAVAGAYALQREDDVTVESYCALNPSKIEYIAHASKWIAVVSVTERVKYLEEEPELEGGVLLSKLKVEKVLKGAGMPAVAQVGQGVSVRADGSYFTRPEEKSYALLEPGKRYVVSLRGTRMYGDGYAVAVEPAEPAAIALAAQQDRWAEAVAANVPQPPCDDVTGDPA